MLPMIKHIAAFEIVVAYVVLLSLLFKRFKSNNPTSGGNTMTFTQKHPTLCKFWAWLSADSTLLTILLTVGVILDRQMLVGFSVLGLLIIKYGNKPEQPKGMIRRVFADSWEQR